MTKILDMPNWTVISVEEADDQYLICAGYDIIPEKCIYCGKNVRLYKHGMRQQTVVDIPYMKKYVRINIQRRRYICKSCTKTFLQPLPDIDSHGTMTTRLVSYIKRLVYSKTFINIAQEVGVAEGTIRNIFTRSETYWPAKPEISTSGVIGITQARLLRNFCTVLTDVRQKSVIDLISNTGQEVIDSFFNAMLNKQDVDYVLMGMYEPYRTAVQNTINAPIVVDKYYVLRSLNDLLEKQLRVGIKLETKYYRFTKQELKLFLMYSEESNEQQMSIIESGALSIPIIRRIYEIKEDFYRIYNCGEKYNAVYQFENWKKQIPLYVKPYFSSFLFQCKSWMNEIFAYFECQNDVGIEDHSRSVQELISAAQADRRGYSFEILRNKVLLRHNDSSETAPIVMPRIDDITKAFQSQQF